MAANGNKNSATGNQAAEPVTKVGSDEPAKRRFPLKNIGKKKSLLGAAIIILIIGGVLLLASSSHIGSKVYAQAAGHKIYKQDVEELIGSTKHVSQHDAAVVLANKYLTEAMAKEKGVTVSNSDIQAAGDGSDIGQLKTKYPYAYQVTVNQAYFNKLFANNEGSYTGRLVVANFSRYVPYQSPLLAQKKAQDPNLGNPQAIAADKKYAHDFITKLYNEVKSGKITFDQAMKMERADPVVGLAGYATQTQSGSFSGPLNQNSLLGASSVRKYVENLKPGELTKPFVVRSSSSMYDDSTSESYYLMVKLDSKFGGKSDITFSQELAQAKKQYGYKIYV